MNPLAEKPNPSPSKRRYLVHLSCASDETSGICNYSVHIRISNTRATRAKTYLRVFSDECELIATINPLLPDGSDIRNIFSHIESPDGFFYLLHLSVDEAEQLGWCR